MVMTPRLRSAALSEASFTSAPRSLNELVTCRFSYLTCTSAPVSAESLGAGSIGVRNTTPSITRRAASTSAGVTLKAVLRAWTAAPCRKAGEGSSSRATPCACPILSPSRANGLRYNALTPAARAGRMSIDIKPHAYDAATQPELFDGVLARRVIAFIIDFIIISIPVVLAAMFIFAFGIVTLGLGFALYWLLPSATVIWAIVYFGATLGGPASATIGMRVMDLEMRTWYGAPAYFVLGAVHVIAFWFTVSFFTPLVLLVPFFNERHRLLHDILLGTVIINTRANASVLRSSMQPARTG